MASTLRLTLAFWLLTATFACAQQFGEPSFLPAGPTGGPRLAAPTAGVYPLYGGASSPPVPKAPASRLRGSAPESPRLAPPRESLPYEASPPNGARMPHRAPGYVESMLGPEPPVATFGLSRRAEEPQAGSASGAPHLHSPHHASAVHAGGCEGAVVDWDGAVVCCPRPTPWFASAHGLLMTRTDGNLLVISEDAADSSETLVSRDAGFRYQGGAEVRFGRRMSEQHALAAVWWSVFPENEVASVLDTDTVGGLATRLDFSLLDIVEGAGTNLVASYFAGSAHQQLRRRFAATNVELNLLHLPCGCGPSSVSFSGGARFLRLDDDFHLCADTTDTVWGDPTGEVAYVVNTENHLIGGQLGGQYFRHVGRRFSIFVDGSAGVFANFMRHEQFVRNQDGFAQFTGGPDVGLDARVNTSRNAVAALGELRAGAHWQFAKCWRTTFSYRLLGVANVALTEDQVPPAFTDLNDLGRIRNHGGLVLHGFLFGVERRF